MDTTGHPDWVEYISRFARLEIMAETTRDSLQAVEKSTREDLVAVNVKLDRLLIRDTQRAAVGAAIKTIWRTAGVPILTAIIAAVGYYVRPLVDHFINRPPQ